MILMVENTTDDTTAVKSQSSQKSQRENQGLYVTIPTKKLKEILRTARKQRLKQVTVRLVMNETPIVALDKQVTNSD